ncbi:PAS-domain containing protein [Marinobacterium sp. 3-1745]|uniref:histidine kinase n=2 Tax=Marinobacterium marinum TaxID=2756129 RepID=A0A7W1WXA2_9GAMM|nr:PAS-domain containing protein [Marinobacterium marinum]
MRLHVDENMLWVVTQAQVAGHRLADDVHRYSHGDTGANPSLRFDILASRLALMHDGPQRRYLEALGHTNDLDHTLHTLERLEPALAAPDMHTNSALIHTLLAPLLARLNSIANAVMVAEWESAGTRIDTYRSNMLQVIGLIIGILFSGLMLVVLLIRALQQQGRAHHALACHRDELENEVQRRTRDLEAERRRVVTAIETAPDGFAAFDNENRLTLVNPQFSNLLPVPPEVLEQGLHLHSLLTKIRGIARIEKDDTEALALDVNGHLQCDLELANRGWRQLTVRKARDGGQIIRVADITNYKAAAKGLERSLQLERGVSEFHRSFAGMVSHQFRTPMAVIDSGLQRLLRRGSTMNHDERQQRLHSMRASVAQMIRLIESSLTAARLDGGTVHLQSRQQDLVALTRQCCRLPQTLHARIQINASAPALTTWCDPILVEQILNNLLTNAIKYSPATTDIHIYLGDSSDQVFCAVEDKGIGIAPDDIPYIFDRFFRSSNASGSPGVGLGLNISLNLAQIQKGNITVTSTEGEGTTFTLWLPKNQIQEEDFGYG